MSPDASDKSPQEVDTAPADAAKPASKPKKIPDWQPLGTVRDSFYELLKQDSRY
jgi:hypothetical protein